MNDERSSQFARAFNDWMEDYVNDKSKFETVRKAAERNLIEKLGGKMPSYGESCAAIFVEYLKKQRQPGQVNVG